MQVNSQKNGSEKIINWASEHFRPWKKRKISTDNTGSIYGGGYHKAEQLKSIKKKKLLIIDVRLIFYIAIEIEY